MELATYDHNISSQNLNTKISNFWLFLFNRVTLVVHWATSTTAFTTRLDLSASVRPAAVNWDTQLDFHASPALLTGSSPWPVWSSRWTRRCDWWIYRVLIKILFYIIQRQMKINEKFQSLSIISRLKYNKLSVSWMMYRNYSMDIIRRTRLKATTYINGKIKIFYAVRGST